MKKSSVDCAQAEEQGPARRMKRLSRSRTGRSAIVLAALGMVVGVVLLAGTAIAATFPDVYSDTFDNPDYPDAVAALSDLGVISGMTDGTFRPHDPVTRQQFAKMIVKILGIPVTGNEVCPFVDVAKGTSGSDPFYPDKYVAVCADRGITQGTSPTTFAPYNNITRAQLLTMVVRAARQTGLVLFDPGSSYYDGSSKGSHFFNSWQDANHAHNAQTAEVNGLLWGIWPAADNTWNPYENATRGEVAQILWRLWQKLGSTSTSNTTSPPGTTGTTAPPTGLLRSDNFSDPTSGWQNDPSWSGGMYERYENNTYVVEIQPVRWAAYYYETLNASDVRVEADITLTEGDINANAGLVLRCQSLDNCYVFEFSTDGYYALYRSMDGDWDRLAGWTYSSAIKTKGQVNHVKFTAIGNVFSGYINGVLLCTATSNYVPTGSAGFFAEAVGTVPVKAVFDNLEVWAE